METRLPDQYTIRELSEESLFNHMGDWGSKIFSDNDTSMNTALVLAADERTQVKELRKNLAQMFQLNLGVFRGDEFCGWFMGEQYNSESFYMRNSAILPAHRGQGLYKALMQEVLRRTQAKGFQVVFSRHTTTNNSIIIPKLKAGFVITALEVSDRFGTLVHLSYFFNQTRQKIMQFRAGDLKPDAQIKGALGIE